MNRSPINSLPPSTIPDADEILAGIIDGLLRDAREGRPPDIETAVRAHPELAADLRELWATIQIAENLAEFSRDSLSDTACGEALAPSNDSPRIGHYELREELGRGGMGVVYKAFQARPARDVALKMLLRGDSASPNERARFRAEAEAAARINHPHIVPVYEVGEHQGQPYFSMKYVEGTTLAKRLAEGPLPPREAARILAPVCRAVAEAHRRGLLHRDLKPSNILLDRESCPYVTDFGLAKRVRTGDEETIDPAAVSLTQSGAILGTPAYMAPEQAAGQRGEVGPATDVYSLGAILYAMLTGRPPFQAASPVDTVLMVLEQEPLPPRLLNQKADADLEMIALKCLQKPIDLRYRTADDLAADLEAYLANEPIAARSSHFVQVVSRAFRDTHHAAILENWGLLWMWHSVVVMVLCLITNWLQWRGVELRSPYVAIWVIGLGVWASTFWHMRHLAGPVTFVERQIAHVWAGGMLTSTLMFAVEAMMGLPVLKLSPILATVSAMVFLVKAGILSGTFYTQVAALALTGLAMAWLQRPGMPDFGITLYGFVAGACFFIPGLKYYRQRIAK